VDERDFGFTLGMDLPSPQTGSNTGREPLIRSSTPQRTRAGYKKDESWKESIALKSNDLEPAIDGEGTQTDRR